MIRKKLLVPLDDWRSGQHVLKHLSWAKRRERLSPEALEGIQREKLARLVDHAYRTTAFYRKRFDDARIDPSRVRTIEDLRSLPPLTKDDLVKHKSDLVSNAFAPEELLHTATGGSTGRHTPFSRNLACMPVKRASEYRFMSWGGWTPGDKIYHYWSAIQDISEEPGWRDRLHNWLIRRDRMVAAGKINTEMIDGHIDDILRFRPRMIKAYPNPLGALARRCLERDTRIPGVASVVTVGEPLQDHHRELFGKVFDCPVLNCYVSRECGNMASQCEVQGDMHMAADHLWMEFVRDGKPVEPGQTGEILVTDFENLGMPFIRYEIGDMGSPVSGVCDCGRTLPRMGVTAGRESDFLRSPVDGAYVSGVSLCHYLLALGPDVGQLQILQDRLDHVTVLVTSSGLSASLTSDHIVQTVQRFFDGKMKVTVKEVEEIPREPSGKYMFCKNLMDRDSG